MVQPQLTQHDIQMTTFELGSCTLDESMQHDVSSQLIASTSWQELEYTNKVNLPQRSLNVTEAGVPSLEVQCIG